MAELFSAFGPTLTKKSLKLFAIKFGSLISMLLSFKNDFGRKLFYFCLSSSWLIVFQPDLISFWAWLHFYQAAIGVKQMFEQLSSTDIQMQDIQGKNYHFLWLWLK